jgi:hypothetical protein
MCLLILVQTMILLRFRASFFDVWGNLFLRLHDVSTGIAVGWRVTMFLNRQKPEEVLPHGYKHNLNRN